MRRECLFLPTHSVSHHIIVRVYHHGKDRVANNSDLYIVKQVDNLHNKITSLFLNYAKGVICFFY